MRRVATCTLAVALTAIAAACAGGEDDERVAIYLKARLGPEGPTGQIAPVLTPVERERREEMSAARQAILDLRVGPAPDERARGFLDTGAPTTRLRDVRVRDGTATVDLAGDEPDFYAAAAIVFSLTELEDVDGVRLRRDGKPCCVYSHAGTPLRRLTRETYKGWQGQPCELRSGTDVRCRG